VTVVLNGGAGTLSGRHAEELQLLVAPVISVPPLNVEVEPAEAVAVGLAVGTRSSLRRRAP